LWTYHSIAHGADLFVYFRLRMAVVSIEIYHNQPNHRVREVAQIGEEILRNDDQIAKTSYHVDIAIVRASAAASSC
jgi:beta-galactosidase